jgi:hypothetical protein
VQGGRVLGLADVERLDFSQNIVFGLYHFRRPPS